MFYSYYEKLARFWQEATRPFEPLEWSIANVVVYENRSLRLRKFGPENAGAKTPILVLSPNAGHHLNICEPLVQRCLKVGGRDVYVVDWKEPTPESANRDDSLDDLVSGVAESVTAAGGKVHLFTLCQGGWLGAIYAALFPKTVASYTDAAGPIDYHAGNGKIQTMCESLPIDFYKSLVHDGNGVQRGDNQLMGFRALNPYDRYVGDYLDLWDAVCKGDEDSIKRWRRFKGWYDQPINLPGKWYLQAVQWLFQENRLINGKLTILGRTVDLSQITCPVWLLGGDRDDITLPVQVFNMEKYISSRRVVKYILPECGHIGVFTRKISLDWWEANIITKLDTARRPIATRKKPLARKAPAAAVVA